MRSNRHELRDDRGTNSTFSLLLTKTFNQWNEISRKSSTKAAHLVDNLQQFCFQDEFPFLVFLARLVSFVVFPANGVVTLSAEDVSDDVSAGRHASLHGFCLLDIHDVAEEVCLAMLTTKILEREKRLA